MMRALAASVFLTTLTGASTGAKLAISIDDLRNQRGMLHLCLSQNREAFRNCEADPTAQKLSRPVASELDLVFDGLSPGRYALAVVHDENANGKLDTFLSVPREGFGFSRNPRIRMGPPSYEQVEFVIDGGSAFQAVQMKYIL